MRFNDKLSVGKPKGQRSNYAKKKEGLSPPSFDTCKRFPRPTYNSTSLMWCDLVYITS